MPIGGGHPEAHDEADQNYGYVRRLAIHSDPTLRSPMHLFVEAFPLVALAGLLSMAYGAIMGGANSTYGSH